MDYNFEEIKIIQDNIRFKETTNKLSTPLECKIPKTKCWATDELNNTFNDKIIINIFNEENQKILYLGDFHSQ